MNGSYRFNYKNCYYLESCLTGAPGNYLDVGAPGVSEASFAELSVGGSAYEALLAARFAPVTTTTSTGDPIDGRYSFGTDRSLLGTNYPFPTILTQSSDLVEGGQAHVHYGDWAVQGILRENGALPVQMDCSTRDLVWSGRRPLGGTDPVQPERQRQLVCSEC